MISDGEWAASTRLSNFYDASSGEPINMPTEAWVTYDSKAIYVAVRCESLDGEPILAREIQPGAAMGQEDHVGFQIDPFLTRQGNRNTFRVNPLGTQGEDLAGGRAGKREWRGLWRSAVTRTANGYTVEMAIPWDIISRPDGKRSVSFNVFRHCPQRARTYFWSDLGRPNRGENDGIWVDVEMPKGKLDRKPQLLGYVSAEGRRSPDYLRLRYGLDAKVRLTESLNGIATISPDFQNIEQQVEAVGFTRTERFLEDRRPFFAEGGQLFSMLSMFGIGRGFYSRRIGEIDAAAKVYGQLNPSTTVGALATASPNSEYNFAGRINRNLGALGSAAVYATAHRDDNLRETLLGSSANYRFGNHLLFGHGAVLSGTRNNSTTYQVSADYNVTNFFNTVTYRSVPTDFNPYLGLIPFRGYTGAFSYSEYVSQPSKGPIERVRFENELALEHKFDGSIHRRGAFGLASIALRSFHNFGAYVSSMQFSDSTDREVGAFYNFSRRDPYNVLSLNYNVGSRGPQKVESRSLGIQRRPIPKLDLGVRYFEERSDSFVSQLVGTASYQFDAKRSLSGRLVQSDGNLNSYLAYREAGFEGSEFFVILGDPNAPSFRTRLAVKWVTPIRW
ncbi:MAG: hypothetical protein JNJ45_02675 [Chthonomonas sp.]|nr:hypothetical protein [Chthonomonas sp.]